MKQGSHKGNSSSESDKNACLKKEKSPRGGDKSKTKKYNKEKGSNAKKNYLKLTDFCFFDKKGGGC